MSSRYVDRHRERHSDRYRPYDDRHRDRNRYVGRDGRDRERVRERDQDTDYDGEHRTREHKHQRSEERDTRRPHRYDDPRRGKHHSDNDRTQDRKLSHQHERSVSQTQGSSREPEHGVTDTSSKFALSTSQAGELPAFKCCRSTALRLGGDAVRSRPIRVLRSLNGFINPVPSLPCSWSLGACSRKAPAVPQ